MEKWRALALTYTIIGVLCSILMAYCIYAYFGIIAATASSPTSWIGGTVLVSAALVFAFLATLFFVIALYMYASQISVRLQHLEEKQ